MLPVSGGRVKSARPHFQNPPHVSRHNFPRALTHQRAWSESVRRAVRDSVAVSEWARVMCALGVTAWPSSRLTHTDLAALCPLSHRSHPSPLARLPSPRLSSQLQLRWCPEQSKWSTSTR